MDTLDDFTVMNIIAQCDMRTAFGVMPLVCRRMYELYDDAVVVRQFRDAFRARIEMLRTRYAVDIHRFTGWRMPNGRVVKYKHRPIPFELVAKARLGDFSLNVEIYGDMRPHYPHIFAKLGKLVGKFNAYFCGVKYVVPCKLTTTFGEVHAYVNRILDTVPIYRHAVMYRLRNRNESMRCEHDTDRDKPMYDLGFGHKYTTMDITVYPGIDDSDARGND